MEAAEQHCTLLYCYKVILLKAHRYGYLPADFLSHEDLLDSSDEPLFIATRYMPQHVLHQLLPPPKHTGYTW